MTVFEKDARSHQYGSNAFSKSDGARVEGTSQSRFGDAGVARGELLRVPLPEFDVAGNATLVLALGGLQEHNVKWLSQVRTLRAHYVSRKHSSHFLLNKHSTETPSM